MEQRALSLLVVDDNQANREVARHVLAMAGHRVAAVTSGRDAVSARRLSVFDAVLMDINMPGMDGLTATLWLRCLETPLTRAPVFALTAYYGPSDRKAFAGRGLDAVMTKPFNLAEFHTLFGAYAPPATSRHSAFARMAAAVGADVAVENYRVVCAKAATLGPQDEPDTFVQLARLCGHLGLEALARAARACASVEGAALPVAVSWLHHEARLADAEVVRRAGFNDFVSDRGAAAPFPGRDARRA